jgi:hypothetical protein
VVERCHRAFEAKAMQSRFATTFFILLHMDGHSSSWMSHSPPTLKCALGWKHSKGFLQWLPDRTDHPTLHLDPTDFILIEYSQMLRARSWEILGDLQTAFLKSPYYFFSSKISSSCQWLHPSTTLFE